jgi:hypothetical protein
MIILPYRKGERPANLTVTKQNTDTVIQSGSLTLTLTTNGFFCENGNHKNLTSFGAEPMEMKGLRLAGGPAELVLAETGGTLTLSGAAGARAVRLPEEWALVDNHLVKKAGDECTVIYEGKTPMTMKIERKR